MALTPEQEALKQAALAATPGPWDFDTAETPFYIGGGEVLGGDALPYGDVYTAQEYETPDGSECLNIATEIGVANGRFIARANPAAILALLTQVEAQPSDGVTAPACRWNGGQCECTKAQAQRCELPSMQAGSESAPKSTLGQQVAAAQAEMATWSPEKRASVRLEGAARRSIDDDGHFSALLGSMHPLSKQAVIAFVDENMVPRTDSPTAANAGDLAATIVDHVYEQVGFRHRDKLIADVQAMLPRPTATSAGDLPADPSHEWPVLDRLLGIAYQAGTEGDELDLIACRRAMLKGGA